MVIKMKSKPCLFNLHSYCIVYNKLEKEDNPEIKDMLNKFGTREWVTLYCAYCIKSLYAKAKERSSKYSVVNTL